MLNIILIYSISITILLLLLIFINRLIFYGKKNPKVPTIINKIIRQTRPPKIKDDTHPEKRFFFGDSSYKKIF